MRLTSFLVIRRQAGCAGPSLSAEPAAGRQKRLAGHVEEERRAVALLRHRLLALGSHLARFFAFLAAHRERQSPETLLRDFSTAVGTVSVGTFLETSQRVVDLRERFGLHLDQRKLDIFLNIGFGAL